MAEALQKVKPGDPLRIPAAAFNAFVDAAEDFKRRTRDIGRRGQPQPLPAGQVHVKNMSGSDAGRFAVLGIDSILFSPTDNPDGFKNQPVPKVVAPAVATHAGRFVVLVEPIADGAVGRAWLTGICPVRVNVDQAYDAWAEVEDGEPARLLSGPNGSARILWCEDPATAGEQWALVQIGLAAQPRPLDARAGDPPPDPEEYGPGMVLSTDDFGRPVLMIRLADNGTDLSPLMFNAQGHVTLRVGHGIQVDTPSPGVNVKAADLAGQGLLEVGSNQLGVKESPPLAIGEGGYLILRHAPTLAVDDDELTLETLHAGGTFRDADGNNLTYDQFGRITAKTPPE